jgi:hypothetical protein
MNKLMKLSYYDSKAEVRLEAYADTVVLEKGADNKTYMAAVRFGGYPEEAVKGISAAVYGGGDLIVEYDGQSFTLASYAKRYQPRIDPRRYLRGGHAHNT